MDVDKPPPLLQSPDPDDWTPFTSQSQFEMAEFLFKRAKMSAGNIDELLNIWAADGAASGIGPPFQNHMDLYKTTDAIPIGGVPWQHFEMSFNGSRPDANVPL